MPRKAKHLTVADLHAITSSKVKVPNTLTDLFGTMTALRLRSWARSEIARRAKAGAGRKVEGKENGSI